MNLAARIWQRWRLARFRLEESLWSPPIELRPIKEYANAVIEWILRAQQATPDGGVAESYYAGSKQWEPSYPETTGYIICSLLRAASREIYQPKVLREAAHRMGTWLLTTQFEDGAFPGGNVGIPTPKPVVFNTGQILRGLTDLIEQGLDGEERFQRSASRAARWMIDNQDDDGAWRKGISPLTVAPLHAYNVRAAWGLARYGKVVGSPEAIRAGVRNAEWLIALQDHHGWFPFMNFNTGEHPLTHAIAYTIQGTLELGMLCENSRLVEAARRAAARMRALQDPVTGAIPGRIGYPYQAIVDWTTATGNSQMAIIWFRFARLTADPTWRLAGEKANSFNCMLQERDMEQRDPGRRGALRGSFPGHRGYGRYWYMNWTQKFHLDALMEQMYDT